MKVVTSLQMQKIDREAILKFGIPSIELMENAGRKVSEVAIKMVQASSSLRRQSYGASATVCVCCGGGNNGGDGLVAARHLAKLGYKVKVLIFSGKLSKDTAVNYEIVKKMGVPCLSIDNKHALNQYKKTIFSSDLTIDALIGTGLKGNVRGFLKEVISFLNNANLPPPARLAASASASRRRDWKWAGKRAGILSIDCPSGLAPDIDLDSDNCIRASATVTLALPKKDLVVYPGAKFVGSLYIADIGIPKNLLAQEKIKTSLIDRNLVLPWFSIPREPDSHKGDFGHVFIIAGSRNTPGASILAARGALRSGAGLVTLGIPESIHPIIATNLTESMTLPLPETEEGSLSLKSEEKILEFISDKADVVAIGPGISLNEETGKLIRNILMKVKKPVLIDADGITHLSNSINILKKRKSPTIITPHPGEMRQLVKLTPKDINRKRIEVVKKFSLKYKSYTVLKGASTVIGTPTGEVFINTTGNSAMSSGGMGDVLSGLIAGYMAQKFSPLQASIMGVYIHGLAGDYLKREMGERGILAGDLAETIPLVSKKVITGELTDRFFLI